MSDSVSRAVPPDDEPADSAIDQAYRLGSRDRYAGRPMLDLTDSDSAALMDELGETGPTTEANTGLRALICDSYMAGYFDASSALGGLR